MFRAVIEEIRALRARVFQAKAAVARSGTRADRADRQRHLSTTRSLLGDVYSRAEELHENILPLSLTPPVPDVSWKRRAEDLMKQRFAASKESGTELTTKPQASLKGVLGQLADYVPKQTLVMIRWWQGGDRPKRHSTRTSRTIQDRHQARLAGLRVHRQSRTGC